MLGIIGGTGLTQLANLQVTRRQLIRTPFGEPSGPLTFGEVAGCSVVFLPRHGGGHTIPPHLVNYRANVWALHSQGVKNIIAIATVGGIASNLRPGDIVLPDQIIDYTSGRKSTFFDGGDAPVKHIDFTHPYCANMRQRCLDAAAQSNQTLLNGGTYAAVQGPRLETAAEINRLERDGATLVGMTGMPEAGLAKELDISYAAMCPVANYAAGRGESAQGIHYDDIGKVIEQSMLRVRTILEQIVVSHAC